MEVYIEYAIVENFILDGLLLYLSFKTVRLPISKPRLLLAALLGSVFAVLFPLLPLSDGYAFAVKYLFGGILCLTAVSKQIKNALLILPFFYLYTFALGGLLLGMDSFFLQNEMENGNYILRQTPAFTVLISALVFGIACVKLISSLYRRYRNKKLLYSCKITFKGMQVEGIGLLDTGNSLTFHGSPVCLIDKSLSKSLLNEENSKDVPLERMYVHTATGGGELKIFQATIQIYSENRENIIENVYLALSPVALGKGYQIILQPQIFREEQSV
ncbi:MAG: sigma-E processing peptidase SpoIIGA [Clostridia bacterium]|nr:sigma-E processing peptidase SpoIIGA [Clostridia bacterium]